MAQYMILIWETPGRFAETPPEQMMEIVGKYRAWSEKLAANGQFVSGERLGGDPGKVIDGGQNNTVTDGPFVETKELIGGFYIISAENYDEACEIANGCPHLEFGGRLEVREIMQMGPPQ